MSPVKYTLCSMSLFCFFSSNGAHFRNWILKTLYIINTLHASSIYRGRFFFFFPPLRSLSVLVRQNLINTVFVRGINVFFVFFKSGIVRANATLNEIQQGVPWDSQWVGGREGVRTRGRESERKIKHQPHFPFKSLKKEPHDVGLRGWTDSTSVVNWGKKIEFSYPLRLRVLGRKVK